MPTRSTDSSNKLRTYRAKRDFGRTPEPDGGESRAPARRRPATRDELSFVVQKHAARRLHYDFRLELDGVLLSWAVPKGPSLDAADKRLAVRTEDHPIEYGDFEGVIPEGEYGGGAVIVWDRGRWIPEGDPRDGLRRGRLTFELEGEKLHGRFHLIRTRGDGRAENWLLFHGKEGEESDDAEELTEREPRSVLSGRTIEEVATAPRRVWHSNRAEKSAASPGKRRIAAAARAVAEKSSGEKSTGGVDLSALIRALPKNRSSAVQLTNLEKVLYPEQGLTKAALVAYYAAAAERMVPLCAGRPLMLLRCPDGRGKQCFFQKHAGRGVPDVVQLVPVEEGGKTEQYLAIDSFDGLIALPQLGALEVHMWGSRRDKLERPDLLVMDLDPDEALPWKAVCDAAFELRQRLADLSLESFVKTTGGKGLHVVAPIERRLEWDQFKEFAHGLALAMVRDDPKRYVATVSKAKRTGKIFVDYLRNARGATAIAPYSTRAREGATVAAPITWDELSGGARPADFTVLTMPERLAARFPDPWEALAETRQAVTAAARRRVAAAPGRGR
jgi:bifunctional non-homologous end joining protein LigD